MAAAGDQTEEESDEEKQLLIDTRAQAARLPSTLVDFYYQSSWDDMIRVALGEQVYGHAHLFMAFTIPMHIAEQLANHMLGSIKERKAKMALKEAEESKSTDNGQ